MNEFLLRDEASSNIRTISNVKRHKPRYKTNREIADEMLEKAKKNPSKLDMEVDYAVPLEIFKYRNCTRNFESQDREIEFEIPENEHIFNEMTEEKLIQILGRKWKSVLKGFLYFVKYEQFCIPKDKQVAVPIATTSKTLLNYFQKPYNIATFIQRAMSVELLWCYDKDYNFWNALQNKLNYSRKYIINRKVMTLIKEVCKKYKIEVDIAIKNTMTAASEVDILSLPSRVLKMIKFGSCLRVPKELTDKQITAALYYNYPWLREYQEKADEMNKTLSPENQIKFSVTIKRSKYFVTKIGIRATNKIVSLKEHENGNKDYIGIWRKDYLKGYFGTENYYHFDVKSSIYRVQYLLNHGTWLPNNVDLYQEIATRKFRTVEDRECFKAYSMYTFFDNSASSIFNHNKDRLPESQDNFKNLQIIDFMQRAKDNFQQVIGKSCKSEIFLHESCIYMDVVKELRSRGLNVVQVYDSFYTDKKVEDIESIVQKSAVDYLLKIQGVE